MVVTFMIRVTADGAIAGRAPPGLPPGEYDAVITLSAPTAADTPRGAAAGPAGEDRPTRSLRSAR